MNNSNDIKKHGSGDKPDKEPGAKYCPYCGGGGVKVKHGMVRCYNQDCRAVFSLSFSRLQKRRPLKLSEIFPIRKGEAYAMLPAGLVLIQKSESPAGGDS